MLCCARCFASASLQARINDTGQPGDCEGCGATGVRCIAVATLRQLFAPLLGMYTLPAYLLSGLFGGIEVSLGQTHENDLTSTLRKDGIGIFSDAISQEKSNQLLNEVSGDPARPASAIWHSAIRASLALPWEDEWHAFKRRIRTVRRYVPEPNSINLVELLETSNPCFHTVLAVGRDVFRARIHREDQVNRQLTAAELGAPEGRLATAGRANATGIPVLYAASDATTSIAEARPFMGAVVSVVRMQPARDLRIFDLAAEPTFDGLDPFGPDFMRELRTAKLIAALDQDFAVPVYPESRDIEYAPTQYVAEVLASKEFDGIRYRSAMIAGGHNFAFFQPKLLSAAGRNSVKVNTITVGTEAYDPNWFGTALQSLIGSAELENTPDQQDSPSPTSSERA